MLTTIIIKIITAHKDLCIMRILEAVTYNLWIELAMLTITMGAI